MANDYLFDIGLSSVFSNRLETFEFHDKNMRIKPYLAKIIGTDPKYKYKLEFCNASSDSINNLKIKDLLFKRTFYFNGDGAYKFRVLQDITGKTIDSFLYKKDNSVLNIEKDQLILLHSEVKVSISDEQIKENGNFVNDDINF